MATVTGRSGVTSLTISPVPAGRLPTDPVAGTTSEGAVEVGAGVDPDAATAVAAGEGAAVGRCVDADGRGIAVAVRSDADGSGGGVTVGSEADGNGDPVAIGSEAEGSGRIVAIGRDAVGSGRSVLTGSDGCGASVASGSADGASVGSSGRLGPTAAADMPSPTNPPITTSAAKATATAPRPAP